MNYRDEEDIFEEDIVFDQAGLLSSARKRGKSAIRRVSSGRCAMLSKTLALCGAFFGLGLSIALPGPATPMPPTDVNTKNGGEEYIYRCAGFMFGTIFGGMLLDRFNRLFLVFLALLMCAILVAMVPWTGITWLLRSDLIILGATMGFLLTGGNVLCLDLWAQNSGPFMQALHFSFSLGAFLAPLIATPLSPALPTVPPVMDHHRFPRDINNGSLGYAEGLYVSPMQHQNFTPVPVSSIAPLNTINIPLLSSQATLVNSSTEVSNLNTSTSQGNSSVSTSTTAIPHSTRHTPKPKPEKNSGKNLDKAGTWDNVHAGKPDPKDVAPLTTTKAVTLATPSSATQSSLSSNMTSTGTVEVSKAITANNSTTTISPIQKIFQNDNVTSKEDGASEKLIDRSPVGGEEKAKNGSAFSTSSTTTTPLSETPVGSPSTPVGSPSTSAGLISMSTSVTPNVVTPSSSKPAQPSTSTTLSTPSTIKLVTIPKSTTAAPSSTSTTTSSTTSTTSSTTPSTTSSTTPSTTSSTTPSTTSSTAPSTTSSSTTPAIIVSPELPPKSLTLTEKKASTSEPAATQRPCTESSSPSPAMTPSTKPDHVEVTSTPRRHHSKPTSYDNDTEVLHSVIDEVADHFGKEYGLSRLQLSYLLVALLLLVVSLLFLGFLCFNPRDPRSRSEDDVAGGRTVVRPRWVRLTLTTLMMLLVALSAGVEFTYGRLLVLFAMRSPLALSQSTGAALTATYWGAATSTRLACILVASALSPGALLVMSVALTAAATWLLSALAAQSAAALWVGAVLVAVGTASILPSSFLWMQQHLHVSHHVAGMLVMGPAMGEKLFPPLAMRIVRGVGDVTGLLHLPALLSLGVIALWAGAWRLARHPCSSLCAHTDPAAHSYQLASQTDEDDLLELTMSPVTHRDNALVARRAAGASHVNGNGVHRHST